MKWNSKERKRQLSEEIQRICSKITAREAELIARETELEGLREILNQHYEKLAECEEENEAIRIIEEEILPFFSEMKSLKNGGKKSIFSKPEILTIKVCAFLNCQEDVRYVQYVIEAFDLPEMNARSYTASELDSKYVWKKVRELAENYNINAIPSPSQKRNEIYFAIKL